MLASFMDWRHGRIAGMVVIEPVSPKSAHEILPDHDTYKTDSEPSDWIFPAKEKTHKKQRFI